MIPSFVQNSTDPYLWARAFMQAPSKTEADMVEWFTAALKAGDVAGYAAGYNDGFENGKTDS